MWVGNVRGRGKSLPPQNRQGAKHSTNREKQIRQKSPLRAQKRRGTGKGEERKGRVKKRAASPRKKKSPKRAKSLKKQRKEEKVSLEADLREELDSEFREGMVVSSVDMELGSTGGQFMQKPQHIPYIQPPLTVPREPKEENKDIERDIEIERDIDIEKDIEYIEKEPTKELELIGPMFQGIVCRTCLLEFINGEIEISPEAIYHREAYPLSITIHQLTLPPGQSFFLKRYSFNEYDRELYKECKKEYELLEELSGECDHIIRPFQMRTSPMERRREVEEQHPRNIEILLEHGGQSLGELKVTNQSMLCEQRNIVEICKQLLRALLACEERGISNLDLVPHSIYVKGTIGTYGTQSLSQSPYTYTPISVKLGCITEMDILSAALGNNSLPATFQYAAYEILSEDPQYKQYKREMPWDKVDAFALGMILLEVVADIKYKKLTQMAEERRIMGSRQWEVICAIITQRVFITDTQTRKVRGKETRMFRIILKYLLHPSPPQRPSFVLLFNIFSLFDTLSDEQLESIFIGDVVYNSSNVVDMESADIYLKFSKAISLMEEGKQKEGSREHPAALMAYDKAAKLLSTMHTQNISIYSVDCIYHIGRIYSKFGKNYLEDALNNLLQAKSLAKKLSPVNYLFLVNCHNDIGFIYKSQSKYGKALEYYFEALSLENKYYQGPLHPQIAITHINIGNVYMNKSEAENALKHHSLALNIRLQLLGHFNTQTANSYNYLGLLMYKFGDYNTALAFYEKGLEVRIKMLGEENVNTAQTLHNMGYAYMQLADYDNSKLKLQRSLDIRTNILGENDYFTMKSIDAMDKLNKLINK